MEKRTALILIETEYNRASKLYPPFASPHEGIAILEEEFIELRNEVFTRNRISERLINEAAQVAAMALRFMVDLGK